MLINNMSSIHQQSSSSVHFPNLNGARFIACFSVFIHHVEQVKSIFHVPNIYGFFLIKNMGKLGVGLFFVLSGFLITYLLMNEKGRYRDINIRNFYMRRVLRIWPLYYLIVVLSCFVFPLIPLFSDVFHEQLYLDANFYKRLGLFSVVLPNIAMIVYGSPYLCAQTWSIGVEEQFYLIWPWIINSDRRKRLIRIGIFGAILIGLLFVAIKLASQGEGDEIQTARRIIPFFFSQFRILTMVIGGAGAYLVYHKKESILRVLFRPIIQRIVYTVLIGMLLTNVSLPGLNLEFYGLFFCFFITNLAANPNSVVRLEQPVISYLGKISYGIYIYHTACIVLCLKAIQTYTDYDPSSVLFNILLYGGSALGTVLVASLSYKYLEQPLLRLKHHFEPTQTPPAASSALPVASPN